MLSVQSHIEATSPSDAVLQCEYDGMQEWDFATDTEYLLQLSCWMPEGPERAKKRKTLNEVRRDRATGA